MRQFKVQKNITQRDSDNVNIYLREIAKAPVLTKEEEQKLISQYRNGDAIAREKILKSNLKFVVSVAKSYHTNKLELNDIISEGNIGLIKALERFDSSRNFKFISYAVWWIRQQIMESIAENESSMHLPANKYSLYSKYKRFIDSYYKQFGTTPTNEEITAELGIRKEELLNVIYANDVRSISQKYTNGNDEDSCLEDIIESKAFERPDETLDKKDFNTMIQRFLNTLSTKEKDVINACFGFTDSEGNVLRTIEQVKQIHKIENARIEQIQKHALMKMRSKFGVKRLRQFLK
jgi:RNA polymerase primary sigma factor